MASDMAEAIRQLISEKGISEELIVNTLQEALLAAYKKKFGTSENAVVRFRDNYEGVDIYAKKLIVDEDDLEDDVLQMSLEEARRYAEDAEVGDIIEFPVDPQEFDLQSVMVAKQTTRQNFRDISRDTLYAEYKSKQGELIIGYYQRERNNVIYVDLGKVEGIFPKKYQSPREVYHVGDRIKALIYEVDKGKNGLQIVLSRSHAEFVTKLLELEIPEIYDKTIEIFKIVREPGYRTKVAVYSKRDDIDPVGACVGPKGMRSQLISQELEGEKIDFIKYDVDPRQFIKNALSPAEVKTVHILDEAKHSALAIVADKELSIAIGKMGQNVKLANRLCDWSIDVKTEEQYLQDGRNIELKRAADSLFQDAEETVEAAEEESVLLSDLPGMKSEWLKAFEVANISLVEDFLASEDTELASLAGLPLEDIDTIKAIIEENIEIVQEETEEILDSEDEEYTCPDCGTVVTPEMKNCPSCGVELSFEYGDDQEA
ncbi:MAG: transcription termination factor NusA [Spirochaetia bacterium]|jgi:N utilization substance protein A|nr:transcription termination factor NusA [Spirochaetia bacterium]